MTVDQTIAYGLHSRIPVCCVAFFVTDWQREMRLNTPYSRAVHLAPIQYVPCPECLALARYVTLKLCAVDCLKDCARGYQRPDGVLPDGEQRTVNTIKAHIGMGLFRHE